MPPPITVPELLDRVRRSGVVPTDRLEGFLVGLQTSGLEPASPAEMLDKLVDGGLITRFHSEKLAAGKYKGFQLGSYLILDQIGTGGMGQVYLAEHINMRRLVALKVLPVFSSDDAVARERFFREARAAGTLDHPNIVRVFDLCQEGKLLYLVMEYVEGVSLQSVVLRHGPLNVAAACHYARQVSFGLQHAFEMGFVHRDIKPANLLVDQAGVVKVLDLGLVRSEADANSGLTKLLDNKSILGTADYVAPEQAVDSSKVDIRADVYSLGATLYFLLVGRPLFPEGRTAQKLVWQQIKEPVPVDRLRPEVPPGLAAVIHKMLQKRPEDRFQTPAEVFDALAPFVPDDVPPPNPAWLPEAPARVAIARSAVPGANAPRVSGSTSQILAAAMRSGSGSTSNSAAQRRQATPNAEADTGKLSITPLKKHRSDSDTGASADALSLSETQRTPGSMVPTETEPGSRERAVPRPSPMFNPTIVITALASALLLAMVGIIILLLRN
jgi:eukaryotic-like serine/threonine-protein kinase